MNRAKIILIVYCMITCSCHAFVSKSTSSSISCPSEIAKGMSIPTGAILVGDLPDEKRRLRAVGVIHKAGSNLQERTWAEVTIEWEQSANGSVAEDEFDSTEVDLFLKCSYKGAVEEKSNLYHDISLLLPLPTKTAITCKYERDNFGTRGGCIPLTK